MNDFQVQLKVKDEEYVKALKQQAEDVEELLDRMRTEFRELQVIVEISTVARRGRKVVNRLPAQAQGFTTRLVSLRSYTVFLLS